MKYTPVLPIGTRLQVLAGPATGSRYTWWRVAPIGVALGGGVTDGWVAVADHDGTPWVALAGDPTPGYDLAAAVSAPAKASVADAKRQAAAIDAFGIALYRRMLKEPSLGLTGKSAVISPYSIVTALAMARAGAKGSTASQMDLVLRTAGWARLGSGLSSLDQLLRGHDATWTNYDGQTPHQLALRTANMAFGQRGFAIQPGFLGRVGRTFGSGLGLVDFVNDTDNARQAINGWVSRQTLGRIPELLTPQQSRSNSAHARQRHLPQGRVGAAHSTRTRRGPRAFTTLGGAQVQVPTMAQPGGQDIPLATGSGWKATELRYLGADGDSRPLAMTLILPDDIAAFERSLSPSVLATVQAELAAEERRQSVVTYKNDRSGTEADCGTYPYAVDLFLPRFGIDTRAELRASAAALGMPDAFSPDLADFTGITTAGAAAHRLRDPPGQHRRRRAGAPRPRAATAVGMDTTGGCGTGPARTSEDAAAQPPVPVPVRDVQTGAILFMGRVADPTQRS